MRKNKEGSFFEDHHLALILGAVIVVLAPWVLYEIAMWIAHSIDEN